MNSLGCGSEPMPDTRLIERWLPIAALGEESVRERRSMTALPPTYYLHVWWARRPLVASRAAVLASLLPADVDRGKFLHVLGIHGDPVALREIELMLRRRVERGRTRPTAIPGRLVTFRIGMTRTGAMAMLGCSLDSLTILDPTAGRRKYSLRGDLVSASARSLMI